MQAFVKRLKQDFQFMSTFTIYHNPRCSKSRQALQLLRDNGIEPEVVLYLENPPSKMTLKKILAQLAIKPRMLLRKGEAIYKELDLQNEALTDAALIDAMHQHPVLIERPIIIRNDKRSDTAVLGRPPENVLELLN
jgi:arsenate reductase